MSDGGAQKVWDALTEAKRMTLMSVRVEGVLTIWRVGAHKRTLAALRESGLIAQPGAGGGLTPLGERVRAIGDAAGYARSDPPAMGGRVSASVNGFKALAPNKRGQRGG